VNLLTYLEKTSLAFKGLLGFALIGAIGILDFLTGYELAFSLFYVLPISFATWLIGRRSGIVTSLVSALVWLGADLASGNVYSHPLVPAWNTLIRLSFFLIIAHLLAALKSTIEHEKELARTDYLTGALNSRFFYALIQTEINRSQRYRHPFTLVYIDLDNFKTVNDQFGHSTGDQALRTLVIFAKNHLRKTDVIARLGGDEFALLFPETDQASARVAITNLRHGLLEEMQHNAWPITFSIGVLTCNVPLPSPDDLIRATDDLMYSIKHHGKNAIKFSVFPG
jgi:diguanylate cyclase (GGDEF)-like protein